MCIFTTFKRKDPEPYQGGTILRGLEKKFFYSQFLQISIYLYDIHFIEEPSIETKIYQSLLRQLSSVRENIFYVLTYL